MKKIAAMMISILLVLSVFSITALAADGSLQFTDPEAVQGKTVDVEGVVRGGDAPLGDISITMTYDANALEFVSGDHITGNAGTVTYTAKGDGTQTEMRYSMRFNVLTAGESSVQATAATATIGSGEVLNLELGSATVKAAEGDGTTAYETPAVQTQTPSEEVTIQISDITTITLLDESSAITLPKRYQKTTMIVNDVEFPAWEDKENPGYFVLYAKDQADVKSMYQYNKAENTYQKFIQPDTDKEETAAVGAESSAIPSFVNNHFFLLVMIVAAIILILLILVVVLAVKLRNIHQEEGTYVGEDMSEDESYLESSDEELDDEYYDDEELEEYFAEENFDDFDIVPPVEESEQEEEDYSVDFLNL